MKSLPNHHQIIWDKLFFYRYGHQHNGLTFSVEYIWLKNTLPTYGLDIYLNSFFIVESSPKRLVLTGDIPNGFQVSVFVENNKANVNPPGLSYFTL